MLKIKPFRELSHSEKFKVVERYITEMAEDPDWLWNRALDTVYTEWSNNDGSYYEFLEEKDEQ